MRGFTLIEIMIVLVLIAVILGLSVFYFAGSIQSYKFYAAVRELSATMRYAHRLAMINGSDQTMTIDLDGKKFGLEGRGYKSIDPRISISVLDPSGGDERRGRYTFIFRPEGGAQGGTVVLGSGKKTVRIDIDPVMGSVVVK